MYVEETKGDIPKYARVSLTTFRVRASMTNSPTTLISFRLITAYIPECSSANNRTIGYSTADVIWRNDDKLPGTQTISWMYLHCLVGVARGVHEQ